MRMIKGLFTFIQPVCTGILFRYPEVHSSTSIILSLSQVWYRGPFGSRVDLRYKVFKGKKTKPQKIHSNTESFLTNTFALKCTIKPNHNRHKMQQNTQQQNQ